MSVLTGDEHVQILISETEITARVNQLAKANNRNLLRYRSAGCCWPVTRFFYFYRRSGAPPEPAS